MTTQINVIVDNGGLSAKAKQQTNANRWAKLEKDGKELVYRRASEERVAALARVGLDPNSNPLYGTSPQLQVRKDEPAASRFGRLFSISHGWLSKIGEESFTSEARKDKYRIYSGDLGSYIDFYFEVAIPPQPSFKWGLQTYDYFGGHDFSAAEWESGYAVSPYDSNIIAGFGRKKNVGYNSIQRSHLLVAEKVDHFQNGYYGAPLARPTNYDELAVQNVQWWSGKPKINGITDRLNTRIRTKSFTDFHHFALPVGAGKMLVVITYNTYETAQYLGQRISKYCGATTELLDFPKDDGPQGALVTDTVDPNDAFGGVFVYRYTTYKYGGYEEYDTVVDSFDDRYTHERKQTRCFLVTNSTVKEVSLPAAFSTALAQRYPFSKEFPVFNNKNVAVFPSYSRLLQYRQSRRDPTYYSQWWNAEAQAYNYWANITDTVSYTSGESLAPQMYGLSFLYTLPDPPSNQLQEPFYGFDFLDDSRDGNLFAVQEGYTPAAFTLLGVTNTVQPKATIDTSYYSSGSGASSSWVFDYRYANGLPEDQPAIGSIKLLKNSMPVFLVSISAVDSLPPAGVQSTLFRAWDWGVPSYCLETLTTLGFTSVDLTP